MVKSMKKLTAMLLSLVMCFSLLAIPARAAFDPTPAGPAVIDVNGPKDPADPGDKDPEEPGDPVQPMGLPGPREEVPVDD